MAYWEFLLQKEGDRSWLPLESPDVEILEGRYRVVARCNRVNTPVEVRVIHQLEDADPPKHRTQKRITKTNQDGLMVVLPFTWLQPGLWELRCSSDVMADMLGQGWQHTVKLDVQPQGSALDDGDWSFDADGGAIADPETAIPQPTTSEPTVPVSSDATAEPATEVQEPATTIQSPETTIQAPISPAEESTATEETPLSIPVRVQMDQDSYATRAALPLVLTGRILPAQALNTDSDAATDSSTEDLSEPIPIPTRAIQAIQVRLLNPQTSDVLLERMIPVEVAALPFAFTCHIDNPDATETHLLIGQLKVLGADDAILAHQSFTVTTDLEALLQAIADDSLLDEIGDPAALTSPFGTAEPPDLTLLNLISKADADSEPQFQVTKTEPIPPQIYHPELTEDTPRKSLDLPSFADRTATSEDAPDHSDAPLTHDESSQDAVTVSSGMDEAIASTLDLNAIPDAGLDLAQGNMEGLDEPPAAVAPTTPAIATPDLTATAPPPLKTNVSLSPTDLEFQALNLQDRFLARLSALASDLDLHAWLQSQYPTSTVPARAASQNGHFSNGAAPNLTAERSTALEDSYTSREFVIEDDEDPSPAAASPSASAGPDIAIPEPLKIAEDQPIPAPQLTLANRDLIAGQPLQILVNLPNIRPRISVKLWLQDPQTRDLLDGPYWLTTFIPNGHDQLEAGLQVMVPFGCVEVQFEAIAVEVATQRESHKVSVHRAVIPPDLSSLPIDNINL